MFGTLGSESVSVTASGTHGGSAIPESFTVLTIPPPAITAPVSVELIQGDTTALAVSVAEPANVSGETFTVTVSDTSGLLSASGATVTGSGSESLSIIGSLSDVNAALTTLTDADPSTASDAVALRVTDSFGNTASTSISVTVAPLAPQFTRPSSLTIIEGLATPLGVSLAEPGVFTGETLTATVADTGGVLSASGSNVTGSGSHNLMITGSVQQVNAVLATLTDTYASVQSDTVTFRLADSLGNAANTSINVTASPSPPVATMSDTLFSEILAMDSYNRGYGSYIFGLSDTPGAQSAAIGDASLVAIDADQPNAFYATSYLWNGKTVISYRGTDWYTLGNGFTDIVKGWTVGAGVLAPQAVDAESFYQDVTGLTIASGPVGDVLLTGLSLGGGLAGYIATLTGDTAQVFDWMPYGAAAFLRHQQENIANAPPLISTQITTEYTLGEILAKGRSSANCGAAAVQFFGTTGPLAGINALTAWNAATQYQSDANNLAPLNAYQGATATSTQLHSLPLLIILQYAHDHPLLTAWQNPNIAAALFSAYFNDSVGSALSLQAGSDGQPGATGTAAPSAQMLTMIAYSAVSQGYMPYGDTAIQSLFSDADALGQFYNPVPLGAGSINVPDTLSAPNITADLADIAVEYAGFLALNAVTASAYATGPIAYDTTNGDLSVNLSSSAWTILNFPNSTTSLTDTQIIGVYDIVNTIFNRYPVFNGMSNPTARFPSIDKFLFFNGGDGISHTLDLSSDTGTDMIYAGVGSLDFNPGTGTTVFVNDGGLNVINITAPGGHLEFIGGTTRRLTSGNGGVIINGSAVNSSELVDVEAGVEKITVMMGADETLRLGDAEAFIGSISGFLPTNLIDLQDVKADNVIYNVSENWLVVQEAGVSLFTLQLSGSQTYTDDFFNTSPDGNGGTNVQVATLSITPNDPTIPAGTKFEDFTVSRRGNISASLTVYVSTTVPAASMNSNDFTPLSYDPVTFAAGAADAVVSVTFVDGNTSGGNQTFGLQATDGTTTASDVLATDEFTLPPNPPAMPAFLLDGGGTLSQTGADSWLLNLGTISSGGFVRANILVENTAASGADVLSGIFNFNTGAPFLIRGFFPFSNVPPGGTAIGGGIVFDPTSDGTFTRTITLEPGSGTAGYALPADVLTVEGTVPSPPSTGGGGGGYGGPSGPTPPVPPPLPTGPQAIDNGDVHLTTFEGLRYDFQAVGEFVLAKSSNGGSFQVQARFQP